MASLDREEINQLFALMDSVKYLLGSGLALTHGKSSHYVKLLTAHNIVREVHHDINTEFGGGKRSRRPVERNPVARVPARKARRSGPRQKSHPRNQYER